MKIFRYLLNETLLAGLAVTGGILAIATIARFSRYLDRAADGKLLASAIVPILFWRLPEFLSLILPLGLALGILMVLGRLHVQGEMPMLAQCGIGTARLALYFQVPAFAVLLLVALLSLQLAPLGSARVEAVLNNPQTVKLVQVVSPGRFHTGGGLVLHTDSLVRDADGVDLQGVFIAEPVLAGQPLTVTVAQRGRIRRAVDGHFYLTLEQGSRYRGVPGAPAAQVQRFDSFRQFLADTWRSDRRRASIDALPTVQLAGAKEQEAAAALQWRLSLPLMVPLLALLAVALGTVHNVRRGGGFLHLVLALIFYLLYAAVLALVRDATAAGRIDVLPLYWPVHAVPAALALLLLLLPAFRSQRPYRTLFSR